ncbi:MAG: tRNA uridine-5-carboxymethylaminomethyl(34) synthesis GTPase MnmE [Oscillospiraceae bacterium]|nr:tRNA uridine-5-carboxymethylaminomethyl(34) synthesis GTPase MnmE [Oscillospiraceae bacterium]
MSDTIAAISTGSALSAIGIIRVSGDDTLSVIDKVFKPSFGDVMSTRSNRVLVYGELHDKEGNTIDLCLCTVSRGPNSYTGEDTAELQCHGSPAVLREGLEALFAAGARQANAGEFTKRAFLNGKMDLTQAEAVIDLIHAESAEEAKNAAGQLGGAIVRKTDKIYDLLMDLSAHYHAVLDYPDEDIEDFTLNNSVNQLAESRSDLAALLKSFERGKVMQSGVPTAIVGRPNAGKSSLLNALLGYERAIVTNIPGTTRDTIEERVRFGGVMLRLIDTAGIRETDDAVEKIGVERSLAAIENAELILAVVDGSADSSDEDMAVLRAAKNSGKPWIFVVNKSDIMNSAKSVGLVGENAPTTVTISAATGAGLDELEKAVAEMFPTGTEVPAGEILTNARQADAVERALRSIDAAHDAMAYGFTPDAVVTEVECAMSALGELTGKTVREDVTARIFERFCVGK